MTTGKPLSNGDDQKAASKIPTFGSKRKNPLLKMKTQVDIGASAGSKWAARSTSKDAKTERKKREEPSAYIDVTTDSIDRHVPGNLPDPVAVVVGTHHALRSLGVEQPGQGTPDAAGGTGDYNDPIPDLHAQPSSRYSGSVHHG